MATIAELEAAVDAADTPIARIDAVNALAWDLRGVDAVRANALAKEMREEARALGYTLGQARATRTQGMTFRDVDALASVFEIATEAMELFDQTDDKRGQAGARDFLSSLHELVGDLAGAMTLALDALTLARETEDPIRIGYALSSLGGVLAATGDVEGGTERLDEALALFEAADDTQGQSTICSRLARILQGQGRLDDAEAYANRYLAAAKRTSDEFQNYDASSILAGIEERRGELDKAEALYRTALDAVVTPVLKSVIALDAAVALARLMMKRGGVDEAHALLEPMTETANEMVGVLQLSKAHELLSQLCEQRGDLAAALEHARVSTAFKEKIAAKNARHQSRVVEIRSALDSAAKDAEIQRLRFVELHGMQTKLVESERMALLGKVAAGAAHELHTPLSVLRSSAATNARMIEELLGMVDVDALGPRAARIASMLASSKATDAAALDRIAGFADRLGRFSELDASEKRPFSLADSVDGALDLLSPPDTITITRHFEAVPEVNGWPREVNLAVLTVLQNAAQALDGAGTITITLEAPDNVICLAISDTGRGMSADQVANLFDVSWSDEAGRVELRLGLTSAYATMQKHDGDLTAHSEEGRGTTITFRFPRS